MISENTRQFTPTPTLGDNFTQVLPNGEVTFRLLAPQAQSVDLIIGFQCFPHEPQGGTTVPMTRNAQGLWSVSLGPLEANLYEYQFNLDGRKIPDPGNGLSKPQRQIETSLLLISGTTPSLLDSANSPHGTIHDETYHSVTLGKNRQGPGLHSPELPHLRRVFSCSLPLSRGLGYALLMGHRRQVSTDDGQSAGSRKGRANGGGRA
jgi:hypothetical protein